MIENSVEPIMLVDLSVSQAMEKIEQRVKTFSAEQIRSRDTQEEERMKKIADLLNRINEEIKQKKGRSL